MACAEMTRRRAAIGKVKRRPYVFRNKKLKIARQIRRDIVTMIPHQPAQSSNCLFLPASAARDAVFHGPVHCDPSSQIDRRDRFCILPGNMPRRWPQCPTHARRGFFPPEGTAPRAAPATPAKGHPKKDATPGLDCSSVRSVKGSALQTVLPLRCSGAVRTRASTA